MAKKNLSVWIEAENHSELVQSAEKAGLSAENFVESLIKGYIDGSRCAQNPDQREFPRKRANLPIVLKFMGAPGETRSGAGNIVDISMGGARIMLTADEPVDLAAISKCESVEMLFLIPELEEAVSFTGKLVRMSEEENLHIAAAFKRARLGSSQALYKYLIN